MQRIPVQNPDGTTAMPTKRTRAEKWVKQGKAQWVKTDLRIKAVRLRTVTRHGFRKGDLVRAEMAGRISMGYVSGDTARQVSVSDFNWKRIGQFTASKVQLLDRATGILVTCPKILLVNGATPPTNAPIPLSPAARGGGIKGVFS